MTEHELNLISSCVTALAGLPNANECIQSLLKSYLSPTNSQTISQETKPNIKNKAPSTHQIRRRRGRPTLSGNSFKLSTKEIFSMPNKIQKVFGLGKQGILGRCRRYSDEVGT